MSNYRGWTRTVPPHIKKPVEGIYSATTSTNRKIYTYAESQYEAFNNCVVGLLYPENIISIGKDKLEGKDYV